jgi:hypothetical protein
METLEIREKLGCCYVPFIYQTHRSVPPSAPVTLLIGGVVSSHIEWATPAQPPPDGTQLLPSQKSI